MTRIDHERNGWPGPEDGAAEEERPIERVRPVRVPGAVAGGRRPNRSPEANGPADGGARIDDRGQSVRLRHGEGDAPRGETTTRPVPPAGGEPSARRRY